MSSAGGDIHLRAKWVLEGHGSQDRESFIVDCLVQAFSGPDEADPDAFRTKFRKMAADPFAFYRGSACVFYADVADRRGPLGRTNGPAGCGSRVTCTRRTSARTSDGSGVLIFDVNDFDEAFVGHFTWDLQRFAAERRTDVLAEGAVRRRDRADLIETFVRAYVRQVRWFVEVDDDSSFSLNLRDRARRGVVGVAVGAPVDPRRRCWTA